MIRIQKSKPPQYLSSEDVSIAIEKLEEFYNQKSRGQKRYNFPFERKIDSNLKKYLHEVFHGKCGYCEIKIDSPELGTVDRYRPHNGVRDKKEYFPDLYWWLSYEWDNLIYCCKECNSYKGNYFPVKGARAKSKDNDLNEENRMLLSPYLDFPDRHLDYNKGEIFSSSDQGYQTIELLRFNRTSLVEKRTKAETEIKDIFNKASQNTSLVTKKEFEYLNFIFDKEPHVEFLLAKYKVLIEELDLHPYIRKYIINDDDEYYDTIDKSIGLKRVKRPKKEMIISDYFPIEYIYIKNFKCITEIQIDFPNDLDTKRGWLFLLGENAVGKSSLLQAIALGIKSNIKTGDESISHLIQRGKRKAEIIIKERNSENTIKTILTRKDLSVQQSGNFHSFLLGYGSLRLSSEIGISESEDTTPISYENLFNTVKALNDATVWLKRIFKKDKDLFNSIAYSIKQLLPHNLIDNELSVVNGDIVFKESQIPYSSFSDGYKSTILLALDIMMKLSSGNADMDKISGIVLIDELGNQLHPRWQMRIVQQLREVFPRVSFIVSTHHPLCIRGSELGEVLLLKEIDQEVVSIRNLPDPSGLRVDQLLSSEYFGLSSLIEPTLEANFNRYYQLLNKENKISTDEKNELADLKDKLHEKSQFGNSLREELMYAVIDEVLAQKVLFSKEIPNRNSLKKEVIDRVKDIWSKIDKYSND